MHKTTLTPHTMKTENKQNTDKQKAMEIDFQKCLTDNIPTSQWLEDIQEEPEAYPDYTADDLEVFLFTKNPIL